MDVVEDAQLLKSARAIIRPFAHEYGINVDEVLRVVFTLKHVEVWEPGATIQGRQQMKITRIPYRDDKPVVEHVYAS